MYKLPEMHENKVVSEKAAFLTPLNDLPFPEKFFCTSFFINVGITAFTASLMSFVPAILRNRCVC